jgi:DNA-directed RNA polymerase specialized sigma24 family protein
LKNIREKDTYSYRVEIVDGKEHITVSFVDGEGQVNEVSISRKLFLSLQKQKQIENSQAYASERYISHYIGSENDDEVSSIAFYPLPAAESTVLQTELMDAMADVLGALSDIQRRRFVLHYVDGISLREIARFENRSFFAVRKSVTAAKALFEEKIKKFIE